MPVQEAFQGGRPDSQAPGAVTTSREPLGHNGFGYASICFNPDGGIRSAAIQNGKLIPVSVPESPGVGYSVVQSIMKTARDTEIRAVVVSGAGGHLPRLFEELQKYKEFQPSGIKPFTIVDDLNLDSATLAVTLADQFYPDGTPKPREEATAPLRLVTEADIIETRPNPPRFSLSSIIEDAETHQIIMEKKTGTRVSLETALDRMLRLRDRVPQKEPTQPSSHTEFIADGKVRPLTQEDPIETERIMAGVPSFMNPDALLAMVLSEITISRKSPEMGELSDALDEVEGRKTNNPLSASYEGAKRIILIELRYRRRLEAEAVDKIRHDIFWRGEEDNRPPRETDYGRIEVPTENMAYLERLNELDKQSELQEV